MYEDDFGVVNDKIEAYRCYIKYTDNNYRISEYKGRCENRFIGFWLGCDLMIEKIYKIYIPEGSIITEKLSITSE